MSIPYNMADFIFPQKAIKALSLLMIFGGIGIYVGWGIIYGSWNIIESKFIPLFAIMVIMVLFGILGILLNKTGE